MTGAFYPFFLPFIENGKPLSAMDQARRIIQEAAKRLEYGAAGFAITYSANYDQSVHIRQTYRDGNWITGTSGANQAEVMRCNEGRLAKGFSPSTCLPAFAASTQISSFTLVGVAT